VLFIISALILRIFRFGCWTGEADLVWCGSAKLAQEQTRCWWSQGDAGYKVIAAGWDSESDSSRRWRDRSQAQSLALRCFRWLSSECDVSAQHGLHRYCAIIMRAQQWGLRSLISSLVLPDSWAKAPSDGPGTAPAVGCKVTCNGATLRVVVSRQWPHRLISRNDSTRSEQQL